MNDHSDQVMMAFLPAGNTGWCHIELPHVTVVYGGRIGRDIGPAGKHALLMRATQIAQRIGPFRTDVTGTDVFGHDEEAVSVLTLDHSPEMHYARSLVEEFNASEYTVFRPHATVGPPGSVDKVPGSLRFDRLAVSWGTEHTEFPLVGLSDHKIDALQERYPG